MSKCRRAPILLLSLLAAALALACSTDSSRREVAARVSPPDAEPVTITWSYWGDEWEATTNARLARAFERDNPHIKIRTEHRPWGEYFTWLRGEWREGRSPDVMFLNYIPSYAVTGELEPLDRFAAADQAGLADFYPALLDSFRFDGKLYGLPRDNDTKVVYYNRAHFREAGLTEPSGDWTWADLRRAALALTKREGGDARFGFGFEPSYWWLIWLWQNGGDVLDDAQRPTAVMLDSPENVATLQYLQDLIHADRVTPPPAQLNTDAMRELFRQGRLSMVFGNHALVPWFANTAELEWDVAPLPRNAARVNVAGGAG
jgi:multiple sugar transport system substrate-binding protein